MSPFTIFSACITLASLALFIQFVRELRATSRKPEARTTIKLNRLLHYRDKAKALDRYMNGGVTRGELELIYKKIMDDKKKYDAKQKKV